MNAREGIAIVVLGTGLLTPCAGAGTVSWDGGGGNALWDNGLNWSADAPPAPADDVSNTIGAAISHGNSDDHVKSFTTNGSFDHFIGGSLRITDNLTFAVGGSMAMRGGLLIDATITNPDLITFVNTSANRFQNIKLAGTSGLNIGTTFAPGQLRIIGGITHGTGAVFNIGGGSALMFDGAQTFDNAVVNVAEPSFGLGYGSLGFSFAGTTLTLGPSLAINGRLLDIGESAASSGDAGSTLVNNANLSSDEGGLWGITAKNITNTNVIEARNANSLIQLKGKLNNLGTVRAENGGGVIVDTVGAMRLGTLQANGAGSRLTLEDDQPFVASSSFVLGPTDALTVSGGGRIDLRAKLNNTGKTLDLASVVGAGGANGAFRMDDGEITGGTLASSGLLTFNGIADNPQTSNVLDGVTLGGGGGLNVGTFSAAGAVRIRNGLTHGAGAVFNVARGSSMLFEGSHTFNNATVNLGVGSTFNTGYLGTSGPAGVQTLTLGAGLNVQGPSANIEDFNFSVDDKLVNNAVLSSDEGGFWEVSFASVTNNGTLRAAGSASGTAKMTVFGAVTSTGAIDARAGGTVHFRNGATQTAGVTDVDGILNTTTDGQTHALTIQGGLVRGDGTVVGNLINSGGIVSPGSSGHRLTIDPNAFGGTGNYTQGSAGELLIELGGIATGEFDVLDVNGFATLDGTLDVAFVMGFTPTVGQTFQFLEYGSRSGTFGSLNSQSAGVAYSVTYNPNGALLTITAVPEPGMLPIIGSAVLALRSRKRVRGS